jgi:EAL domain-containing protein (putative c-di-GMP-specific phosphodiesterase class I)
METMISLSHRIGASVVAEGVENEQQLEFLRNVNCDFVQGWHLGKPMPADVVFKKGNGK